MKKTEAMKIIKDELIRNDPDRKLSDRRTNLAKAVQLLDDFLKWDEARIEGIIDETIEEFERKENDYAEEKDQ